jgi:hypothetical protein
MIQTLNELKAAVKRWPKFIHRDEVIALIEDYEKNRTDKEIERIIWRT